MRSVWHVVKSTECCRRASCFLKSLLVTPGSPRLCLRCVVGVCWCTRVHGAIRQPSRRWQSGRKDDYVTTVSSSFFFLLFLFFPSNLVLLCVPLFYPALSPVLTLIWGHMIDFHPLLPLRYTSCTLAARRIVYGGP